MSIKVEVVFLIIKNADELLILMELFNYFISVDQA